jgi:hypothetical protein
MIQEGYYLINCDDWFVGPDGEMYSAVWGYCKVMQTKDTLGFNPARSANWFVQVGTGEGAVVIAGCRIHYAVQCINRPKQLDHKYEDPNSKRQLDSNRIYFVEPMKG